MPAWLETLIEQFLDFVPIRRWVGAVGNALQGISLAFILFWVLLLLLLLDDWGWSTSTRFVLFVLIIVFDGLLVGAVILLAWLSGEGLFNPYQNSLRRSHRYGSERMTRSKKEVEEMESKPTDPALPPPGQETEQ